MKPPSLDFRFFCLNAHYRKKLNFTFDGLTASKISRERIQTLLYQHKISPVSTDKETLEKYRKDFIDAINDDVNIPLALGVLFNLLKEQKSKDVYALALEFDKVFGLDFDKVTAPKTESVSVEYPQEVADLIEKRKQAKKDKNFALADEIRSQITALGYSIKDTREGVVVSKI